MTALRRQQRGATLIIALIFLVVLTVVALSGMQTASTEIQTARRVKSQMDVFNAAEEALKYAENVVQNNYADPVDFYAALPSDGLYLGTDIESAVSNLSSIQALLNSPSVALSSATTSSTDTEGSFFIEYMGPLASPGNGGAAPTDRYLYRITAIGQMSSGGQRKMVQSYYVTSP
ncbi:pilus assembly PilX family protein [Motiliproteus sediminis]|uniref:pilus assembly PilX family protein n=1 Tax=Motiliproteus sediminis TaxID=1468178 RepID=UPI001AEFFAFF|nr:PilX N-terminal domain-containing pilus assembly protein [Motiliproteus sediminis]